MVATGSLGGMLYIDTGVSGSLRIPADRKGTRITATDDPYGLDRASFLNSARERILPVMR